MWGYACGPVSATGATCTAANGKPQIGRYSHRRLAAATDHGAQRVILTITLINNLSFANGNTVPTSLVIVGQLGGGLGDAAHDPSPSAWLQLAGTRDIDGRATGDT